MVFKRKVTTVTIIFMFLLLLVNSIEGQRMIGIVRLKAQNSWYACSTKNTDYLAYNLTVIPNNVDSTPNFGNYAPGWPLEFKGSQTGVIVLATNNTEMMNFLNPDGTNTWYYSDFSCIDEPVTSCIRATTGKRLSNNTIQCLAVANPMNRSVTCKLDINFNAPTGPGTTGIINSDASSNTENQSLATTNIPIISLIYFINIFWTFYFIYT